MNTYFGYRYEPDGRYHAADRLSGEQEMFDYLKEKKSYYQAVKITDSEDYMIAESKDGHIIFPEYLALVDIRNEGIELADRFDPADFMKRLHGSGIQINVPVPNDREQAEQLLERLYVHYVKLHRNQG